jgi:AcrR family transcriptional regulator
VKLPERATARERVKAREHGQTRAKLLEAACRVFAEKGYRDATNAEICELAGANIAAINYHFRDKETLYAEAWRLAFQRSQEKHPFDGGVPATAPAAQRLRGHIRCLVNRMTDPDDRSWEIAHKEMAHPTGLLAEVMTEAITPIQKALFNLVRELLGERATEQQVRMCAMSILALCLHPMEIERHRRNLPENALAFLPPLEASAEEMVDHVYRFSLAGIEQQKAEGGRQK